MQAVDDSGGFLTQGTRKVAHRASLSSTVAPDPLVFGGWGVQTSAQVPVVGGEVEQDVFRRSHPPADDIMEAVPFTHWNPYGIEDAMIVRKVTRPEKVFRVSGITERGRATFVALLPGERTVMNGSAKNYRPETAEEAAERHGGTPSVVETSSSDTRAVETVREDSDLLEVPELCVRMQDAVARVADGECDAFDAAAIVTAAAALNEAVMREAYLAQ